MSKRQESIFSALSSYSPQPSMNPRENFLTELLAWIVNNVDAFGEKYVSFLLNACHAVNPGAEDNEAEIEAVTQQHVSTGYIDMVIYDKGRKNAFICEHKIDSPLSENQIKKYMDNSRELEPDYRFYSVLLTKRESQHVEPADVMTIWSKITQLAKDTLDDESLMLTESDQFVLEQFVDFMNMEGLGVSDPINCSNLLTYFSALEVSKGIEKIFRGLTNPEIQWQQIIPGIEAFPSPRDDFRPCFENKWGRMGISFFSNWRPGLFAGVILDGTDHRLEPVDRSKGPDLVVLLDANLRNAEEYNQICTSEWFQKIMRRLKSLSNREGFIEASSHRWKLVDAPKNRWRIAILQTPLFDVIENCRNLDDQSEKIKDCLVDGINLFLTQSGNT